MSKGKKAGRRAAPPPPAGSAATPAAPLPEMTGAAAPAAEARASWLDSPDPRRRLAASILVAGIWIYVGALCLLALDQTLNWGIFGPASPVGG